MAAEQQSVEPGQEAWFRDIILKYLSDLPEPLRELVCVAAIPRHFDAKILAVVLAVSEVQASGLYKRLQDLSPVQAYGQEKHTIYDFVRSEILRNWIQPALSSRYREYNRRLTKHYNRLCDSGLDHSRIERAEAIYHQIAAQEEVGFPRFEREFLRALEFGQFDHCSDLLEIVRERKTEIDTTNRLWLDFHAAILAERLGNLEEAKAKFKHLAIQEGWLPRDIGFFVTRIEELTKRMHSAGITQEGGPSSPGGTTTVIHVNGMALSERSMGAEAQLASIRSQLDEKAQQQTQRRFRLYLGILIAVWVCSGILIRFADWSVIEPWICFSSGGFTVMSIAYFVFTHREFSPGAIYKHIEATRRRRLYEELGIELARDDTSDH